MIAQHALEWLAQHENYELSYCWEDEQWQVYRVNGGINDREWTCIGVGETPLAALENAYERNF